MDFTYEESKTQKFLVKYRKVIKEMGALVTGIPHTDFGINKLLMLNKENQKEIPYKKRKID